MVCSYQPKGCTEERSNHVSGPETRSAVERQKGAVALLQLERTEGTKEDGITADNLLNVKYDANAYALPKSKPTEAKQTREERDETRRKSKGARHREPRNKPPPAYLALPLY